MGLAGILVGGAWGRMRAWLIFNYMIQIKQRLRSLSWTRQFLMVEREMGCSSSCRATFFILWTFSISTNQHTTPDKTEACWHRGWGSSVYQGCLSLWPGPEQHPPSLSLGLLQLFSWQRGSFGAQRSRNAHISQSGKWVLQAHSHKDQGIRYL